MNDSLKKNKEKFSNTTDETVKMDRRRALSNIGKATIGAAVVIIVGGVALVNYLKRDTLILEPLYFNLLFLFYSIWFLVSLLTPKVIGLNLPDEIILLFAIRLTNFYFPLS